MADAMNHFATWKPNPKPGRRLQRRCGRDESRVRETYARLASLFAPPLVAFGVSACSTSTTMGGGTADAGGAVEGDAFGSPNLDASDLRDGVDPTTHYADADAASALRHERFRASAGFASTQGAKGWYYRQFDGRLTVTSTSMPRQTAGRGAIHFAAHRSELDACRRAPGGSGLEGAL